LEAVVRRVIVLGGRGGFGRAIVEQLANSGIAASIASRSSGADVRIDANERASIAAGVRRGDIIIDAAGPFHSRLTALAEAAIEIGVDLIDINDDLGYGQRMLALESRIASAGIRVLSSASTVSAVSAAVVRHAGIAVPMRVSSFLVPASRQSAKAGVAKSLLHSVGRPISIWRGGRLQTVPGWSEPRQFNMPAGVGRVTGRLFETADAIFLPRIWPSLREAATYVDTNTTGVNSLLQAAARWPLLRRIVESQTRFASRVARWLGAAAGGVGYEIEDGMGRVFHYAIAARENSHLTAVVPVILAAEAIVAGRFGPIGLVMPDQQVEPAALFDRLHAAGIRFAAVAD
jgi:predicted dinucleotide-binding enzyme